MWADLNGTVTECYRCYELIGWAVGLVCKWSVCTLVWQVLFEWGRHCGPGYAWAYAHGCAQCGWLLSGVPIA